MNDVAAWREKLLDGPEALALTPMQRALMECFLEWPGLAIDLSTLESRCWTRRGLISPPTASTVLKVQIHRLRGKLSKAGLNPQAIINDPPSAYGLNLDALATRPVRRPRYMLTP